MFDQVTLFQNQCGLLQARFPQFTCTSLGMGRTWEKFSSLPAKKPQLLRILIGSECVVYCLVYYMLTTLERSI